MNHAVQFVTNVVTRSARTGGCLTSVAHGTESVRSRAASGSGVRRAHVDHATSHTTPMPAYAQKITRHPHVAAIHAESGIATSVPTWMPAMFTTVARVRSASGNARATRLEIDGML